MSKKNVSATIDPEVAQYLDQEHINKSATINKALKSIMGIDEDEEQILNYRIQQVESELEELRQRTRNKERELETLKSRRNDIESEREGVIEEAAEVLGQGDHSPKDRPVQYWASEAGVSENELIERIEEYHNGLDNNGVM